MKVIELIEKISKGEEVPKKIKIETFVYEFEYNKESEIYIDEGCDMILEDVITFDKKHLGLEVKILEDSPKELKKLDIRQELNIKNNWKWKIEGYNVSAPVRILGDKVNEIIEYIESKEMKGE